MGQVRSGRPTDRRGGSIALIVLALLGAIVNAWEDSGTLVGLVVIAAVAAAIAAFLRTRTDAGAKPSPIPLETIEFAAGAVATVLAVLRVVELAFDFDDLDSYGGVLGAVVTVGLLVAAGAVLVGALRRDPTLRADILASDRGTRLAVAGLALVVLAWLLNLSIGFWNMNAAATSVALLTFGAVLVVVQRRWLAVLEEVPLGWVGAGFGVVGLLLAIGLWGELMDIGRTRVDLEFIDFLPQILSFLGIAGIIVGGILAGLPTWQARIKVPPPAVATPPTTPPAPATAPAAPAQPPAAPAQARPNRPRRRTSRRPRPAELALERSGHRALPERHARAAIPLGDDLREDREGGLGRRPAAEVEPDRTAQLGEFRLADAGLEQPRAPIALRLLRADGADVATAAPERLDDGRLVELHVVGEDGDRVVRPEADLVGDLVGPADDQPIDIGEPLGCGERRAAIDDDGLEAELAREPDERSRDLDGPDDHQARPDREDLDEQRAAAELDGPRESALQGLAGGRRPARRRGPASRASPPGDRRRG